LQILRLHRRHGVLSALLLVQPHAHGLYESRLSPKGPRRSAWQSGAAGEAKNEPEKSFADG
jgi:hypothetical protein